MDTEGSNYTQTTESSNFIVLDSQLESQTGAEENVVQNWPALQVQSTQMDEEDMNGNKAFLKNLGDTSGEETRSKGPMLAAVFVTDSEMEGPSTSMVTKGHLSSDGKEIISESEDMAEITVIEKLPKDQRTEICEEEYPKKFSGQKSDNGSGSSFHTNSQADLGSYNQAEMSRSQLRGQRFPVTERPTSPFDLFGEEKEDEEIVSTPSDHFGSLQLSDQPMLVPETVDDDGNIIPPSPEVYGSQPIIIPSSPTDQPDTSVSDHDETVYNPAALATLKEDMDIITPLKVVDEKVNKESSGSFEPHHHSVEDIKYTEDLEYVPGKISTLAADQPYTGESLMLHYTETEVQNSGSKEEKNGDDSDVIIVSPDDKEQSLQSERADECDGSQHFQLRLSPSQSEKSQGFSRATHLSQTYTAETQLSQDITRSSQLSKDVSRATQESEALVQCNKTDSTSSNQKELDVKEILDQSSIKLSEVKSQQASSGDFHLSLPKDGVLLHPADNTQLIPEKMVDKDSSKTENTVAPQARIDTNSSKMESTVASEIRQEISTVAPQTRQEISTVAPQTRQEISTVSPQTRQEISTVSPQTRQEISTVSPQTRQEISTVSPQTRQEISTVSPQTRQEISTVSPQTRQEISTVSPQTRQEISTVSPQTRQEISTVSPQTRQEISTVSPQTRQEISTVSPQTRQEISTVSPQTRQEISTVSPEEQQELGSDMMNKWSSKNLNVFKEIICALALAVDGFIGPPVAITEQAPVKSTDVSQQSDFSFRLARPDLREVTSDQSEILGENIFQKTKASINTKSDVRKSPKKLTLQEDSDDDIPVSKTKSRKRRVILEDTEDKTEMVTEEGGGGQPKLKKIRSLSSEVTSTGYKGSVEEESQDTMATDVKQQPVQANLGSFDDNMMEDTLSYQASQSNITMDTIEPPTGKNGDENRSSSQQRQNLPISDIQDAGKHTQEGKLVAMETIRLQTGDQDEDVIKSAELQNVPQRSSQNSQLRGSTDTHRNIPQSKNYEARTARKMDVPDKDRFSEKHKVQVESRANIHFSSGKRKLQETGSHPVPVSGKRKRNIKVRKSNSKQQGRLAGEGVSEPRSRKLDRSRSGNTMEEKVDPFDFHGTESQFSPEMETSVTKIKDKPTKTPSTTIINTPLSSRKTKRKLLHKKSNVKSKARERDSSLPNPQPQVKFNPVTESLTTPPSRQTDNPQREATDTFVRSPSIGQYSQQPKHQNVRTSSNGQNFEPVASTSRDANLFRTPSSVAAADAHSVMRASAEPVQDYSLEKRTSFEQFVGARTPEEKDELKRFHVVEELKLEVHKITEEIWRQGKVISRTVKEEKKGPEIVKITRFEEVCFITPEPSPSRTTSTMTSGDLGDISSVGSSLSRSSDLSRGSKQSLNLGSLDRTGASLGSLDRTGSSVGGSIDRVGGGSQEAVSHAQPIAEEPNETSYFTPPDQVIHPQTGLGGKSPEKGAPKEQNPVCSTPKGPSNKRVSIPSDVEMYSPHDVSTINKTGSDALFTSPDTSKGETTDHGKSGSDKRAGGRVKRNVKRVSSDSSEPIPCAQKETRELNISADSTSGPDILMKKSNKSSGESDYISPVVPYQDQEVRSVATVTTRSTDQPCVSTVSSTPAVDTRVMAKWKDGFYYPGKISKVDKLRYHVKFDDGSALVVKLADILVVNTMPEGQPVMVQSTDDDLNYDPGIIIRHEQKNKQVYYHVEKDDGKQGEYTLSQLILREDQAAFLVSSTSGISLIGSPIHSPSARKMADVSLDNLVEGRRRAGSRYHQKDEPDTLSEEPIPSTCTSKQTTKHHTTRSRGTTGGVGSSGPPKKEPTEEEPQTSTRSRKQGLRHTSAPTPKGKVALISSKTKGINACPVGEAVESPVAPRRSPRKTRPGIFDPGKKNLFRGMAFLLTHVVKSADQKKQEKELLKDSSLDASATESSSEEVESVPFDKDNLRAQIEAGGGVVLEKYDEGQISAARQCFLVSDDHQKTLKYFQCLAAGIPCISHLWITDSFAQGCRLNYKCYMLPAGISLEKKKLIEWNVHGSCLKGLKVYIVSENKKFQDEWSFVMKIAESQVLSKLPVHGTSEVYCVITDQSCPPSVLKKAKQHNVPVVSTQWVIQTLIHGCPMDFTGHPKYRYDYSEDT